MTTKPKDTNKRNDMTKLSTATQFFLPMYEGDHSAFDPYKRGEVQPDARDMDALIDSVFDGVEQYLDGLTHTEVIGKRGALSHARKAYSSDPQFAQALQAWCLERATQAAAE
jgi:hypothetical protein